MITFLVLLASQRNITHCHSIPKWTETFNNHILSWASVSYSKHFWKLLSQSTNSWHKHTQLHYNSTEWQVQNPYCSTPILCLLSCTMLYNKRWLIQHNLCTDISCTAFSSIYMAQMRWHRTDHVPTILDPSPAYTYFMMLCMSRLYSMEMIFTTKTASRVQWGGRAMLCIILHTRTSLRKVSKRPPPNSAPLLLAAIFTAIPKFRIRVIRR